MPDTHPIPTFLATLNAEEFYDVDWLKRKLRAAGWTKATPIGMRAGSTNSRVASGVATSGLVAALLRVSSIGDDMKGWGNAHRAYIIDVRNYYNADAGHEAHES